MKKVKDLKSWRTIGIPGAVWAAGLLFFSLAAKSQHLSPLEGSTWARWDSLQYLSIATDGYKIWNEPRMAQGRLVEWRGNTAWFPLYPMVIRRLTSIGIDPAQAAHAISEFFCLLTLIVLWNGFLKQSKKGYVGLALASVFPGAIYYHASFPMSLMLFLVLMYLYALTKKWFEIAYIAGLLAGAAYTSGLYLVVAVCLWRCLERADRKREKPLFWAAVLAPLVGAGLVFVMQRAETQSWTSFFRVFEFHKYNGWSWIRLKQMLYIPTISHPTEFAKSLVLFQSLSVLAAMGLVLKNARKITSIQRLLLIVVLIFWITPHLSPYRLSWYRAESLLVPMVIFMSEWPESWQAGFLLVWMPLAWFMALEFFRSVLV